MNIFFQKQANAQNHEDQLINQNLNDQSCSNPTLFSLCLKSDPL